MSLDAPSLQGRFQYLDPSLQVPRVGRKSGISATKFAPLIQEVAGDGKPMQWRPEVGAVSSGIVGRTKKTPLWRVGQLRGLTECPRPQR